MVLIQKSVETSTLTFIQLHLSKTLTTVVPLPCSTGAKQKTWVEEVNRVSRQGDHGAVEHVFVTVRIQPSRGQRLHLLNNTSVEMILPSQPSVSSIVR